MQLGSVELALAITEEDLEQQTPMVLISVATYFTDLSLLITDNGTNVNISESVS